MLTHRHLIQILLYHHKPRFGELGGFLNYVSDPQRTLRLSDLDLLDELAHAETVARRNKVESPHSIALQNLVIAEIREIQIALSTGLHKIDLSYYEDFRQHLTTTFQSSKSVYARIGIEYDADTFVVSEYPAPFNEKPYQAMHFDSADEINFGMKPGIYFIESGLRPIYSGYIGLHETVHAVLGAQNPTEMVCGIEEGLCELIGSIFLMSEIESTRLAENLFIYNRLLPNKAQIWDSYLSNTRLATVVYHKYGWNGLFTLLKKGRPALKAAEERMFLEGNIEIQPDAILKPKDNWKYSELINSLMMIYNDTYFCSPLACYIAKYALAGRSLREISVAANLPLEAVREGLVELEENLNLIAVRPDGSVVSFSDAERSSKIPMRLRYSME